MKLWLGFAPGSSGVWSAGNGPAMRSALLGVCYGDDWERLRALVRASSRLTHTDPRAEAGALAVAVAAHLSSGNGPAEALPSVYLQSMEVLMKPGELWTGLQSAVRSVQAGETTDIFAASIGAGERVTGYVNQTVPVAAHAWLSFPEDYAGAVQAVIRCGGDTDTTAAIAGAIVGARVGRSGIPGGMAGGTCRVAAHDRLDGVSGRSACRSAGVGRAAKAARSAVRAAAGAQSAVYAGCSRARLPALAAAVLRWWAWEKKNEKERVVENYALG